MSESISVVVATFNGSAFIEDQLRSITGQSRSPDEIVVVDDGSRDRTVQLARAVLGRTEGIRYRVLEATLNRGVVANFSRGLEAAAGSLIALADQDDVWHPDKLRILENLFLSKPALLLAHSDARLVDRDGRETGDSLFAAVGVDGAVLQRVRRGDAVEVLLRRNIVTGATVMMRHRLVDLALPVPPGWIHDEWLAVVAALHNGMATVPDRLVDYRQHGSNQIGARSLTVEAGLARLTVSRTARNARLLERAVSLEGRVAAIDSAPQARAVRAKADHERARSHLPAWRFARLPGVARILRSGGYRRFGNGVIDALRDLVQPD